MKVLLLYPNLYGMNMMPPAIGIFTSILKNEGHTVALFDTTSYNNAKDGQLDFDKMKAENLNARPYDDTLLKDSAKQSDPKEDFKKLVNGFSPDLIALSVAEDIYPVGVELLRALGPSRPPVVAGGVFPTFAPELTLEYSHGTIDYVIRGEGEESLVEFCRRLEHDQDIKNVPGLVRESNGQYMTNPLPRTVDPNTIPLPDYSLFDDNRFYRPMQGELRRMLPIETHRGCPYSCGYCNSPSQNTIYKDENMKFFRKKRMDLVRDELIHCRDVYKADSFYFWADTFLAWNNTEFDEFCELYSDIKLPFWIQTRPETITEQRIKKLKDVGILRIAFGIEHGDEDFRARILSRKVKNEVIIRKLDIVADYDIPFSVNNIMGFPTETRDLVLKTIELNRPIRSDGINAYTFTPFHGTPLRKMAEQLNLIDPKALTSSIGNPTILKMPYFTADEMEGIRRTFVLYVKLPKSMWPHIEKAEQLTPEGDKIFHELKDICRDKYMNYSTDKDIDGDLEKILAMNN